VLQNITNLWRNIEFFSMDLYLCDDSEELYRKCGIVKRDGIGLSGIIKTYELAVAGRREDVLDSIKCLNDAYIGLAGACFGGHKELVLLMIQKTKYYKPAADFNGGLVESCMGGHKELVLLMIENGADRFDKGLSTACQYGHAELALIMIEKGAKMLNWGLESACMGGHEELALLMIRIIESSGGVVSLNGGLSGACWGGQKKLALMMIEKGATDFNSGLTLACLHRYKELVLLMIKKGATYCRACRKALNEH
jgi:hypothetical protein